MESRNPKIAIFAHGISTVENLAAALSDAGAQVVSVDGMDTSRRAACAAFVSAVADADCVVVAVAPLDRGNARPLLQWSAEDWLRCADEAQFALFSVLQGLRDALAGRTCPVVLIGGTLGITGAANHTALATATEGQRGMMKGLARQWGPQMRFVWLAVSTPLLFPDIALDELPEQCELGEYTPSLGSRPGWSDVAGLIAMLGSPNSAGITGQTLVVDGGEWMLP